MTVIEKIRADFPQLNRKVYDDKKLVYLDNSATSLKPLSIIATYAQLTTASNANIHRAVHAVSLEATKFYEDTRQAVREYLNAKSNSEIIFTSGCTQAINLVSYSFGDAFISEGDEIIVTDQEHNSNFVPWKLLCERKKAVLKLWKTNLDNYTLPLEQLESLITPRTKLVCFTHISNMLGIVNPVKEIVSICHKHGVRTLVDGAQGIVHQKVDVQDLDCDFYVFSGHKIYASTGTGVLFGKEELLQQMPPFMGGGEMIDTVSFDKVTYATLPYKFEAGTQNFASIPSLRPAIKLLNTLDGEDVLVYSKMVKDYVYHNLTHRDDIVLYGTTDNLDLKAPVFSFTVKGCHHEDLAMILDKMGIAVRSGKLCANLLMNSCGIEGVVRASFAPFNTLSEAHYFIQSLDKAIKMLR